MEDLREGIAKIICKRDGVSWDELSEGNRNYYRGETVMFFVYLKANGVKKVTGGISDNLIQAAADSDKYYADGIGYSWERNTGMFEVFKKAGYERVEDLI